MSGLPGDLMIYYPDNWGSNPNLTFWHQFKTEVMTNITQPISADKSIVIEANKTCIIPGGCVFFVTSERIGSVTVTRKHRGHIGLIPYDNTHAKLYIILGSGDSHYPGYTPNYTYVEGEPPTVYTAYALGYLNKDNDGTWETDPDLNVETTLIDPPDDDTIKAWDSNKYTGDDSDLFTTFNKTILYTDGDTLEDHTGVCSILARVPSAWDEENSSLYSTSFDYHNVSSYSYYEEETHTEDDRGKILQFIQSSPFIATPMVMTPFVRTGMEAFAFNKWFINTSYVRFSIYGISSTYFYNNPITLNLSFNEGSGMAINPNATSITIELALYGYGTRSITVPISVVPDGSLKYDDTSIEYNIYELEEDYIGKLYYTAHNGNNLKINFTDFGYAISPSTDIWSNLKNYATKITVTQNSPDVEIFTDYHPYVLSGTHRNLERKFCVGGNPDFTLMNLSTLPEYDENFPEGFISFFPTLGKPVSLLDESLSITSAIVYDTNNASTGAYSWEAVIYNEVGLDRTRYIREFYREKLNYIYTVTPRLGTPDKDLYVTAGADLDPTNNPEWCSSGRLKLIMSDSSESYETYLIPTTPNWYWDGTKLAGNFNYIPSTGLEGATVTYIQVFKANAMYRSFNDDANYVLSTAYPTDPDGVPKIFLNASPTTQYEAPYFTEGGRIYFDVSASNWFYRVDPDPDVPLIQVSRTSFSGASSTSIYLWEIWRGKHRACCTFTLYYKK